LLYDLLGCLFVAVGGYGYSSEVFLFSWADGDAFNVKVSSPEKVGDSVKHTWFVLNDC
jgi:hypothetical protein